MTRTWTIRNRETGEVGTVMDVTGKSERELQKAFNGLVYKVDFERWALEDSAKTEGSDS